MNLKDRNLNDSGIWIDNLWDIYGSWLYKFEFEWLQMISVLLMLCSMIFSLFCCVHLSKTHERKSDVIERNISRKVLRIIDLKYYVSY